MRDALTLISLVILSVQDIRKGEVDLFFLSGLCGSGYLMAYVLMAFLWIGFHRYEKLIGGADVWIMCLLMSRYGLAFTMGVILYSSIAGLVYCLCCRKREVRFIPFLTAGFIMQRYLL